MRPRAKRAEARARGQKGDYVGAEHLRAAALRGGPRRGGEGAGGRVPPGGGEGGDGMGLCVGGGRWRVEEEGEAAGSFEKVPPEDLHREVRLGE